ncbi:hypothetical protein V8G54_037093 [Vigna mungo]|uniref:Uncharacterized protein n=1 Tax=Vigna mungo TaxID=3915 RepID=A0AAQ3MIF5_VIGMU
MERWRRRCRFRWNDCIWHRCGDGSGERRGSSRRARRRRSRRREMRNRRDNREKLGYYKARKPCPSSQQTLTSKTTKKIKEKNCSCSVWRIGFEKKVREKKEGVFVLCTQC